MEVDQKMLVGEQNCSTDGKRLVGNGCTNCSNRFFPKRTFCPACLKADTLSDFNLPDTGTLYTYTIIHTGSRKFHPPYAIGYVDVDEQLRLFGHIQLHDSEKPVIGQRMNVSIGSIGAEDEQTTLMGVVFTPAIQH